MAKAIGQITIRDENDITVGTTAPSSPVKDQMWLDTSTNPSILKRYTGSTWDKVSDPTNDIKNAIDGVQIGGRNLIIRSNEIADKMIDATGIVSAFTGSNLMNDFIPVTPGESLMFSQIPSGAGDNYFRYCFYANDKTTVIRRTPNNANSFKETVPTGAYWLRVSYDADNKVKLERGNKITDWTVAPEDIEEKIESNTTSIGTQQGRIDTLVKNTTITKNGVDITLKDDYSATVQTVEGITQKVSSLESRSKKVNFRYIRDWLNGSTANTGNHWIELKVVANGVNIAKGIVPTGSSTLTSASKLTDEVIDSNYVSATTGWQWVQIDLGSIRTDIDMVKVWHYYTDGRQYNHKLQVSSDGVTWFELFNSDINGTYKETIDGRTYTINETFTEKRVSSAESSITSLQDSIKLKVEASDVTTAINNIQIGGRNLLPQTDFKRDTSQWGKVNGATINSVTGKATLLASAKDVAINVSPLVDFELNTTYTLSANFKDTATTGGGGIRLYYQINNTWYFKQVPSGTNGRVSVTFTTPATFVNWKISIDSYNTTSGTCDVCEVKLEKGNTATDWTPASEDIQTQINSQEARLSSAELKIDKDAIVSTVTSSTSWTTLNGNVSSAKSTADSVSGTVNTNKSTWDKANNFDASGKLATSKLNGTVADNQVASSSKWNTASEDATTVKGIVSTFDNSIINPNPIFLDWSSTYPVGYSSLSGTGLSKVVSGNGMGNAVKFVVTAGASVYLNPTVVSTVPFFDYLTIECTFMLESGTVDGSGILVRYNNSSAGGILADHRIHLKDLVPSPVLNKWYTVTKTIKQTSSTNFYGYQIFPMGGWTSFGTVTAKTIQFDSVKVRPSTEQEINAYESKIAITDMSTDGKITPLEKQQLKKEWSTISVEKTSYESLATTYVITTEKTNYVNSYNTLNTTLNGASGILVDMTTTSTVDMNTFRSQFNDYYDKKALLTKKINETAKTIGDTAQSTANTLKNTTVPALEQRVLTAENQIKADSIISTVSSVYLSKTDATNTYASKTSLTQTATDITAKFTSNGGYNLLKNGALKNSSTYWSAREYSLVGSNLTRLFNVRNDTWTGGENALQLQINSMTSGEYGFTQGFATTIGKKYVFTCYLAGHRSNKMIIVRGTTASTSAWLTNQSYGHMQGGANLSDWTKVIVPFTAQRTWTTVEINITSTIGTDGYVWAKDLMVSEGDDWKPFSPNPTEIYEGSTMIDASGVTVKNGALKIQNNAGTTVFNGDNLGNLVLNGGTLSVQNDRGGVVDTVEFAGGKGGPAIVLSTKYNGVVQQTASINLSLDDPSRLQLWADSVSLNGLSGGSSSFSATTVTASKINVGASGLAQNGNTILNGSDTWLRTTGDTGWYSSTYGGGWYMTDTTWIRAFNSKSIYTPGSIRCDNSFQLGNDGRMSSGVGSSVRMSTASGYADIGAQNTSYFHFYTDRPNFYFDKGLHTNGNVVFYQSGGKCTIAPKSTGDIMLYTTARSRFEGSPDGRWYWYKGSTATWYLIAGANYGD